MLNNRSQNVERLACTGPIEEGLSRNEWHFLAAFENVASANSPWSARTLFERKSLVLLALYRM
jgi:hypothetical protein